MIRKIALSLFQASSLIRLVLCLESGEWKEKMRTSSAKEYFDHLQQGLLNTTIPQNILVSQMVEMDDDMANDLQQKKIQLKQMADDLRQKEIQLKQSYVDKCAIKYRNIGTYYDNHYMMA